MTAITNHKVSLACGTAGAYVDVSADSSPAEGNVTYIRGRKTTFDSIRPGVFSFTLDNRDGKYTPDNPLSSLVIPLTEGMGACWQINGRFVAGTIRSMQLIIPAGGKVDSARLRVVCDDMLGTASRRRISSLTQAIASAGAPWFYYRMNEAATSAAAIDSSGNQRPALTAHPESGTVVFGSATLTGLDDTAVSISSTDITGPAVLWWDSPANPVTIAYTSGSMGYWGLWACFDAFPPPGNARLLQVEFLGPPTAVVEIDVSAAGVATLGGGVGSYAMALGTWVYFSVGITTTFLAGIWTLTSTLYANGVSVATYTGVTVGSQRIKSLVIAPGGNGSVRVANLSHTPAILHEEYAPGTTETTRLQAVDAAVADITFDTLPATLSTAPLTNYDDTASALNIIDNVMRGEQGHIRAITTGSLTAPVEKLVVTARSRTRAVDYTFDISEIHGAPDFIRQIANTVAEVTASSSTTSATSTNYALADVVGMASTSESVEFANLGDVKAYAEDRILRGTNSGLPIASITIDANSLNRWTDLLDVDFGDRLRITGLPSTQLGYSTWDGWVVGSEELYVPGERGLFTFNLHPAYTVPVFGTARFGAGGILSLTSNITNVATSISVTSTGDLFTTSGAFFPQTISIDRELFTVSAVAGGASPQTFTVARAATNLGGVATLAATHAAGALIELYPVPRFDY